jgi:hypothetical protein
MRKNKSWKKQIKKAQISVLKVLLCDKIEIIRDIQITVIWLQDNLRRYSYISKGDIFLVKEYSM